MNSFAIHVDTDSPRTLLRFWGIAQDVNLEGFFHVAMARVLQLFDEFDVKATFFVIGEDLKEVPSAKRFVKQAFTAGHEIANHTHTHPFGLTTLDGATMLKEIIRCSDEIESLIGVKPVGFRAPGYDIDERVMCALENLGFRYDASGFWSVLNPIVKLCHFIRRKSSVHSGFGRSSPRLPRNPYYPSPDNMLRKISHRRIMEVPLTRSLILQLPFYMNFHLYTGSMLQKTAFRLMRQSHVTYLFHLIEFVDFHDKIPSALNVHPHLHMKVEKKLAMMRRALALLKSRWTNVRTDQFVEWLQHDRSRGERIHCEKARGR